MPKSISVSQFIAAPRDRVFADAIELKEWPNRISAITKIDILDDAGNGDRLGPGTVFTETRFMFKREASETMTVSWFEPNVGYDFTASSHGCDYLSTVRYEDADENGTPGTMITVAFNGTPKTPVAKLMGFMMGFMAGSIKKCLADDLADIKSNLESPQAAYHD